MSNFNSKAVFHTIFNLEEIPMTQFNKNWRNGTDYYVNAVKGENAPVPGIGMLLKSEDEFGRKIIIVGTRFGNVVLFDRYSDKDSNIIAVSMPRIITELYSALVMTHDNSVSKQGICHLTGVYIFHNEQVFKTSQNIGTLIEQLMQEKTVCN